MKGLLLPPGRPYVCASCRNSILKVKKRRLATSPISKPDIYDVVSVGGGPVGLGLLAALKSSPTTRHLKTALIESQDLGKARQWHLPAEEYSNRASSLTPSSVSFLEKIGGWKHVAHTRTQPYDTMQVYDASNDAHIQFDWKAEAIKYNAPPRTVATMTENSNLTKALLDRISELDADSSLLTSTSVASVENGQDDPEGLNLCSWPVLSLKGSSAESSRKIAARLLIGADGFNSPVRTFAGISSHGWDYDRHGVVATLTVAPVGDSPSESFESLFAEEPPANRATAWQRFLPALGGPIALLPLPDNHASLVWSTTPANAAYLKSLPLQSFLAMVNAAFSLSQTDLKYMFTIPTDQPPSPDTDVTAHQSEFLWRIQHTPSPLPSLSLPPFVTSVQPGTVASFPLRFRQASSYIAPRVALAGDAAHTIHPLAGQGLNLGLGDAAALARTIEYAVLHGQDLGDLMTLERYGRERWGRGLKMGGMVDGLEKVYGFGAGGQLGEGLFAEATGWARGVGMKALGSRWASGFRGWIMGQAEG